MLNRNFLVGLGIGGSGPHRYWRMRNTSQTYLPYPTAYNFACAELKWRDLSGTEISTGGTPFASSSSSGYGPEKAHDGAINFVSGWFASTTSIGEWIAYDFGYPVLPHTLDFSGLAYGTDAWQVDAVAIDFSDNGTDWTQHKEYTGLMGSWVAYSYKNFLLG